MSKIKGGPRALSLQTVVYLVGQKEIFNSITPSITVLGQCLDVYDRLNRLSCIEQKKPAAAADQHLVLFIILAAAPIEKVSKILNSKNLNNINSI
jgi:hypothetical protein